MSNPPEEPIEHLFSFWTGNKPKLGHINKKQFMLYGSLLEPFSSLKYGMEPYIKHIEWLDSPEGRQHVIDTYGLHEKHPDLNNIINEHKRSHLETGLYASENWPQSKDVHTPPGFHGDGPLLSGPPV